MLANQPRMRRRRRVAPSTYDERVELTGAVLLNARFLLE
jgi:hypothetical protein